VTREDECGICGGKATHYPVGAEYDMYCCFCFHDIEACPHLDFEDIDNND
jgi:hypothetical protein